MRRAVVAAILLTSTTASADEPAEEDPKAAMKERGLIFKVGKKNHYLVVVPVRTQGPSYTPLDSARVFYGDSKVLFQQRVGDGNWIEESTSEELLIGDVRSLYGAKLIRTGESHELRCSTDRNKDARTITLKAADPKLAASLARTATIRSINVVRFPYFFGRLDGTTYLLIDQVGNDDLAEPRLLLGKRGAMKPVAIKEIADDSASLVMVTAKGTLTVTKPTKRFEEPTAATLATAKKSTVITPLPIAANRALIHLDLGVYGRERTGHPCDDN